MNGDSQGKGGGGGGGGAARAEDTDIAIPAAAPAAKKKKRFGEEEEDMVGKKGAVWAQSMSGSGSQEDHHRGKAKLAKLEALTGRTTTRKGGTQQQQTGASTNTTTSISSDRGKAKLAKLEASTGRTTTAARQQAGAQQIVGASTNSDGRGQAKLAKLEAITGRTTTRQPQTQQQQQQHGTTTTNDRGQAKLAKLEAQTGRTPRSRQQQQQVHIAIDNDNPEIAQTQQQQGNTASGRGEAKLAKLEAQMGRTPRSRQQQQQQHNQQQAAVEETAQPPRGQAKLAKLDNILGRDRDVRSRQEEQNDNTTAIDLETPASPPSSSNNRPPTTTTSSTVPMNDQAVTQEPQPQSQQQQATPFTDADLVEAQPVVGESSNQLLLDLPQAERYSKRGGLDTDAAAAAAKRKTRIIIWSCLAFGILAVVAGIVVAVLVLGNSGGGSYGTGGDDSEGGDPPLPPATVSPTQSVEEILKSYLPNHTLEAIRYDPQSPQSRAFNWLQRDKDAIDELGGYIDQEWRVKQRFALLTFFYATAGDTVTSKDSENLEEGEIHKSMLKEEGWLEDSATHECDWWQKPSLFHASPQGLSYNFDKHKEADRCDDTKRYQHLWLWATDLFGKLDRAPEFFSWLPNLKTLCLDAQGEDDDHSYDLEASQLPPGILFGRLPSEVGLLTDLEVLSLNWNLLNLTLPTEIGLMTELRILRLQNDRFSNIPSEIGKLSHLIEIDMSSNALEGTIPTELFGIATLERLNLGFSADVNNYLRGPIASQIGMLSRLRDLQLRNNDLESLPTQIGQLQELTNLDMSFNALGNNLPSEVGLLKNLLHAELAYDEFSGALPTDIGTLQKLTFLDLSYNQLTGDVPTTIGEITGLATLNLNENLLSGSLLLDWGNLSELKHLELGSNSFSGFLPSQIGSLMSLTYLDLSSNNLDVIPSEIGRLSALTRLDLSSNNFDSIPSEVQQLTALSHLDLSSNNFHGTVPASLISLVMNGALSSLDLDWNMFTGDLPFELFMLSRLSCGPPLCGCDSECPIVIDDYVSYLLGNMSTTKDVVLHWSVALAGTIPSTIGMLSNLEKLDFGWQLLSGNLPTQLGRLVRLRELKLSGGLDGAFPSTIGLLPNLEILDLSGNGFSGILPSELGLLTYLESLDASSNQIMGSIPTILGNLEKLTHLDLRENNLSGFLVSELGMLTSLTELFLSSNALVGSIPNSFGMMTDLSHLDLSSNLLSGSLPNEVGMITALSYLDLSSNRLFGTLPNEFGLVTALTEVDLSDNMFTGTLDFIDDLLDDEDGRLREIDIRNTTLSGNIPFCLIGPQCWVEFQCSAPMCGCDHSCHVPFEDYLDYLQEKAWEQGQPLTKLHVYRGFQYLSPIPSSIGLLSSLQAIELTHMGLQGSLPSEIGLLTKIQHLRLNNNFLSGVIPLQLGLVTALGVIRLEDNELTGEIPPELGDLVSLTSATLSGNALSGSMPSQLALMTSLEILELQHNMLTGPIPLELEALRLNNAPTVLKLANNSLSGTIPEGLCSLGVFDSSIDMGLSFDCSDQLCGCCWCPCPESNYGTECETHPFVPLRDDKEWPGQFPTLVDGVNAITLNIRSDEDPGDTSFDWSRRDESGLWEILESGSLLTSNSIHSYMMEVESDSVYRLQIFDRWGNGVCCRWGLGWFTITNSTPSTDHDNNGTVIWAATGDVLVNLLSVFISTDPEGLVHNVVEYIPKHEYDEEWPGQFPTRGNGTNAVTINIRTDEHPEETSFEWSRRDESGLWGILELRNVSDGHSLHSYTMEVEPDSVYRLQIFDTFGDGISNGGWITITNSTPSILYFDGTVIWEAKGDVFSNSLDVFVWIDQDGLVRNVEYTILETVDKNTTSSSGKI